ncbi:MAG: response regulator transcription factor [Chloroflexota bacterium]
MLDTTAARILLVEDDPSLALALREILEGEGYAVSQSGSAAEARAVLDSTPPDLVILDLLLPDADGLVFCADIKARSKMPVVICSGTSRKRDSVLALKLGADDFIAKPFDVDVLISRVGAVLRRTQSGAAPPSVALPPTPLGPAKRSSARPGSTPGPPPPGAVCTIGLLTLEHARKRVSFQGADVPLTATEYRLLSAFMASPDEVLSRRDLAQIVWGYEDASVGRSIDVHVHRLRMKLQRVQALKGVPGPNVISVRGFGYTLLCDVSSAVAA